MEEKPSMAQRCPADDPGDIGRLIVLSRLKSSMSGGWFDVGPEGGMLPGGGFKFVIFIFSS
jgi:hypothetical protein